MNLDAPIAINEQIVSRRSRHVQVLMQKIIEAGAVKKIKIVAEGSTILLRCRRVLRICSGQDD